jgi:hypothetical protein
VEDTPAVSETDEAEAIEAEVEPEPEPVEPDKQA